MWKNSIFRDKFSQDYQLKGIPQRTIIFTTDSLLQQLSISLKWSLDGTHRVTPKHFSQLFITMMKVGDKWLPALFGLLANHDAMTYQLYIEMIKHSLSTIGLQHKVESILTDFEVGIMTAVHNSLPKVEIRGCRFHYGQAIWRHAEHEFGKTMKSSKQFSDLVRRCLGLPFILTDELQNIVDQLKILPMETENITLMRDKFMSYIQNTWISGVYSPDSWSCFGRRSDMTDNAQEAYNSVLNRLVQVAHPSIFVLLEHFVIELNYSQHKSGRQGVGKMGRAPKKTIYETISNETERLKTLYLKGEVSGGVMVYLLSIGFLHSRIVEESSRNRNIEVNDIQANSEYFNVSPSITEPTHNDMPISNNMTESSIVPIRNRLEEMTRLGFGERSFTLPNSPYTGRVIGITARVQARKEHETKQNEYNLKNKKCLKCNKKFLNGVLKKSKVVQCHGCSGFVHLKSTTGCMVDMEHEAQLFYCEQCSNYRNLSQPLIPTLSDIDIVNMNQVNKEVYNLEQEYNEPTTNGENAVSETNVERETSVQETILFNNPQAESSRLEQDYSINKNESNNQQTIAVTVIEQRGNNPSAESSRIENENESNIQQTIVETVIEQRGKEIYKSCSICRKMLN